MTYRNGKITLETEKIKLNIKGIKEKARYSIIDIERHNILIRADWLMRNNPIINQFKGTIKH